MQEGFEKENEVFEGREGAGACLSARQARLIILAAIKSGEVRRSDISASAAYQRSDPHVKYGSELESATFSLYLHTALLFQIRAKNVDGRS